VYVLYDRVHLKRTNAAVKGAEKIHYILAFETHCIIYTTVYGSHEIIYGIILECYETRQCKNENENKSIRGKNSEYSNQKYVWLKCKNMMKEHKVIQRKMTLNDQVCSSEETLHEQLQQTRTNTDSNITRKITLKIFCGKLSKEKPT